MFEHSSHHFDNFTHRSGRGGGNVVGGVPSGINEPSLALGGKGGGGSLGLPILSGIDLSTSIGREPTE